MPAEMRRIAVLSLEPDPGNAGVGMRLHMDATIVYPRLVGMRFFVARRHFPTYFEEEVHHEKENKSCL